MQLYESWDDNDSVVSLHDLSQLQIKVPDQTIFGVKPNHRIVTSLNLKSQQEVTSKANHQDMKSSFKRSKTNDFQSKKILPLIPTKKSLAATNTTVITQLKTLNQNTAQSVVYKQRNILHMSETKTPARINFQSQGIAPPVANSLMQNMIISFQHKTTPGAKINLRNIQNAQTAKKQVVISIQ